MNQSAFLASTGASSDAHDFNQNYDYLKKLIQELKGENTSFVRQEIFGEQEEDRKLTKKEMKQIFRFLRKIEGYYEECCTPPIPEELEQSIRAKDNSRWLPWEQEAMEKVDSWRQDLREKRQMARQLLHTALDKVRSGEKLS
jgi:hypothetical protein